jgi:hypothetical protein
VGGTSKHLHPNAFAEEIEASTAGYLAFRHLQPVDVAFNSA